MKVYIAWDIGGMEYEIVGIYKSRQAAQKGLINKLGELKAEVYGQIEEWEVEN